MKFRDERQRRGHRAGAGRAEEEVKCARYRVAGDPGKWRDRLQKVQGLAHGHVMRTWQG